MRDYKSAAEATSLLSSVASLTININFSENLLSLGITAAQQVYLHKFSVRKGHSFCNFVLFNF